MNEKTTFQYGQFRKNKNRKKKYQYEVKTWIYKINKTKDQIKEKKKQINLSWQARINVLLNHFFYSFVISFYFEMENVFIF